MRNNYIRFTVKQYSASNYNKIMREKLLVEQFEDNIQLYAKILKYKKMCKIHFCLWVLICSNNNKKKFNHTYFLLQSIKKIK